MLANIILMAQQVGSLFLMMGVGYLMIKFDKLSTEAIPYISNILILAVTPCVIITSFQISKDASLLRELGIGFVAVVGSYVLCAVLARFLFKKQPPDTRASMQYGMVYGNTGFMGLPLIQAVLGDDAMIYASLALIVFHLFAWTHGTTLMGGKQYLSIKNIIVNAGILSAIVGLIFFFAEISLPPVVLTSMEFMASMNTPLAMVVIGAQMASANIADTFRKPLLYRGAVVKLLVFPLLTTLALYPLGLPPLLYSTICILAATPCAGYTTIFSIRHNRDANTASQLVTLTTLLSILTLPLFGALCQFLSYG